jgi:hypothetical protein
VEKIELKNYLVCRVLHFLTDELRLKRVELLRHSLEPLDDQHIVGFPDIVTGDESRFLQHYDHKRIWYVLADEVLTMVSPPIAASKTILTMFLSVRGAIFINRLYSASKFDGNSFYQSVLRPLAQILQSGRNTHSPKPIVHFDNATLHRSIATETFFEGCRFRHVPQPPYSHDISPCDFFLFGDLKAKLGGEEFETLEQLQERLEELLSQITPEIMERVYRH